MKKLIPAMALLLISAMLLSTSTFAWFSMNNKVTVTGMEVKTKVSSSLLITADELGATSKKADSEFTYELTQTVQGILEPASTADALNFYYTIDAGADGHKIGSDAFIQYNASTAATDTTSYADKFSEVYGVTKTAAADMYTGKDRAVPYVDYVFQLKATNTTESTTQYIDLTKLELTYHATDSETDDNVAHRIAIFVQDITSATSSATPSSLSGIYKIGTASNFNGKVVNGTAATAFVDADYVDSSTPLATVAAGQTKYYKVVVRMWLEGQDTTCNNETFMQLNGNWTLVLELTLRDADTSVTEINKVLA